MPAVPTYPGIYVEEVPSGIRPITGASTSVTSVVGYFLKGPMNTPTRVFSFTEFQRIFGSLNPESPSSYAVWQFFLNGGQQAVIVRVAAESPDNPEAAGVTIKSIALDGAGPLLLDAGGLVFTASSPGTWGNLIGIQVQHVTPDIGGDATTPIVFGVFNLIVTLYDTTSGFPTPVQFETLNTLSMDVNSPRYVQSIVNNQSELIRVAVAVVTPSKFMPCVHGFSSVPVEGGTFSPAIGIANGANAVVTITSSFQSFPANYSIPLNTTGSLINLTTMEQLAALLQSAFRNAPLGIPEIVNATFRVDSYAVGTSLPVTLYKAITIIPGGNDPTVLFQFTNTAVNKEILLYPPDAPATETNIFVGASSFMLNFVPTAAAPFNALISSMDDEAGTDGDPPVGTDIVGTDVAPKTGMYSLDDIDIFNILITPDIENLGDDLPATYTSIVNYCEKRFAMYIFDNKPDDMDTPSEVINSINDLAGVLRRKNSAVYFPRLKISDPIAGGAIRNIGNSGAVAGIWARTDLDRGVWKAPAGVEATVRGVNSLAYNLTDNEIGLLNPLGINSLRTLPVYGQLSWGARTLVGADIMASEWKYIPVRRLALLIEQSLIPGTQFAVFEPNDEPLWGSLRNAVGTFMQQLYRQGAFAGATPSEAYFVQCDASTTTPADQALGIVNVLIGFTPLRPAEFIFLKIQQITGQSTS